MEIQMVQLQDQEIDERLASWRNMLNGIVREYATVTFALVPEDQLSDRTTWLSLSGSELTEGTNYVLQVRLTNTAPIRLRFAKAYVRLNTKDCPDVTYFADLEYAEEVDHATFDWKDIDTRQSKEGLVPFRVARTGHNLRLASATVTAEVAPEGHHTYVAQVRELPHLPSPSV